MSIPSGLSAVILNLIYVVGEPQNYRVNMGVRRDNGKMGHVVNKYYREGLINLLTSPKMISGESKILTGKASFHPNIPLHLPINDLFRGCFIWRRHTQLVAETRVYQEFCKFA